MELRGVFNSNPNGCLCHTPNNRMCNYDNNGFLEDFEFVILDDELCLFYKSECVEHFNINYCPLCGKSMEGR